MKLNSFYEKNLGEKEIEKALKIIKEGTICDNCLGRQFAKISFGLSNKRRGEIVKNILREKGEKIEEEEDRCWVCNNLFSNLKNLAVKALWEIKKYEFDSFLVGTKVSGMLSENEEMLWEIVGATYAEPLKTELNREIGKIIEKKTEKRVDFDRPDIIVILNLWEERVELQINHVFIYGRYKKLKRGIPQTRWFCRQCRGRGCEKCDFTGKMYAESVEELIKASILDEFKGSEMILHGSGREDVDARVLGSGRPFVAEIKSPRRRKVDLMMLEKKVNKENKGKIEVVNLKYVEKDVIARIKNTEAKKTYRVKIRINEGEAVTEDEKKNALAKLVGVVIEQRTPKRVLHRRADLKRKKRIYKSFLSMKEACAEGNFFWLDIKCDGGLYIKELVSGDEGRTKPSLSELIGKRAEVVELDVVDVDALF